MRTSKLLFCGLALGAVALAGCVGSEDNPASVRDLRVLAISLSPPELMSPDCGLTPAALGAFSTPVSLRALIEDPKGEGRPISYQLHACAWPGDRTCEKAEDRVFLGRGTLTPGEFRLDNLLLGQALIESRQQLLLQQVFEQDQFKGLGGLRMPLVLEVSAGEETIHAQKLMVFSCRFFPDMKVNEQPVLPGMSVDGQLLLEAEKPTLNGQDSIAFEPLDFFPLQEHYVVPSYELSRVELDERWRISWHTDVGYFAPGETGGLDFSGNEPRHTVSWLPPPDAKEGDVNLWAVARDGRGGLSWLQRSFHYVP